MNQETNKRNPCPFVVSCGALILTIRMISYDDYNDEINVGPQFQHQLSLKPLTVIFHTTTHHRKAKTTGVQTALRLTILLLLNLYKTYVTGLARGCQYWNHSGDEAFLVDSNPVHTRA